MQTNTAVGSSVDRIGLRPNELRRTVRVSPILRILGMGTEVNAPFIGRVPHSLHVADRLEALADYERSYRAKQKPIAIWDVGWGYSGDLPVGDARHVCGRVG